MEFTAEQIAQYCNGEVVGNPETKVTAFAKIEEAEPNTLTFLSNPKYAQYIEECNAGVILVNRDIEISKKIKPTLIKVDNAYETLAKLLNIVESFKPQRVGISPQAYISPTAKVGTDVYIAPFVSICDGAVIADNVQIEASCYIGENVKIGNHTQLHAGVKVEKECIIGNNCILQAGAVVGSDGFGFAPAEDGTYSKIPQIGNVVIEDDVEVGANSTIDRATFGSTIICKGVKLDNLVQIAHNVTVEKNTVIAAQSGVAGSTTIGEHCVLAGQVGVAGHIKIASGSIFGAQTGVASAVKKEGSVMQGYPAIPVEKFRRASIVFKNLPELQKMVYELKREIEEAKK